MKTPKLTRRKLFWATGLVGTGLLVGIPLLRAPGEPPIVRIDGDYVPNAFLQITPANEVRFYCPRDEMGQGITTGLATLIGEELDVDPAAIEVEFAGVHADYVNPAFGVQGTGGSTSLRAHFKPLREAAANVRATILAAAATDLGVSVDALETKDGHVVNGARRLPYGQFVRTAATLELVTNAPLKAITKFRYIGKEFPRIDAMAKATGTATFGIDVEVPGKHYALIKRCPVVGGTMRSFSSEAVAAMPGVTDVVPIASGVAVVAKKFWQAKRAVDALTVEWELPPLAAISTAGLREDYEQALAEQPGETTGARGDLDEGFARAATTVESKYFAPYLAHAPLEPMNALVQIKGGWADVWSGTQGPDGAQGLVARFAGLDKARVRVHSTYLGGGFGRRGLLTHIVEATQVAAATAKPIQVVWTREDDIRNGAYRPASLMRIKAGVGADGTLAAWEATRVGGNIMPSVVRSMLPGLLPTMVPGAPIDWVADAADHIVSHWVVDSTSVEGLYEDYDVSNRVVRHVTREHGLPLLYWRSVGHSYTAFAKESMIDELAHAAKIDPVEFRVRNTVDNPRLRNVVRIAGERLKKMRADAGQSSARGVGLAAHASFLSYVAQVADVSIDGDDISVNHVLCVIDCGQVVNPDIVRAQMEGAVMFGLTAALYGKLELDGGEIIQSNFHDYRILRMNEAPSVEVVIVDSDEPPSGVGEPGLPPIAPAVANAVFAASGKRLRELPLKVT